MSIAAGHGVTSTKPGLTKSRKALIMAADILPPLGTHRGGAATGLPSRRAVLEASLFTALTGIAAVTIAKPDAQAVEVTATPHADAELLALCIEQERAWKHAEDLVTHLGDLYGAHLPDEAYEQEGAAFRADLDLQTQIAALPAQTLAGLAAKARVLQHRLGYTRAPDPGASDGLVWSLTADLLRSAPPNAALKPETGA